MFWFGVRIFFFYDVNLFIININLYVDWLRLGYGLVVVFRGFGGIIILFFCIICDVIMML